MNDKFIRHGGVIHQRAVRPGRIRGHIFNLLGYFSNRKVYKTVTRTGRL